MSSEKVDKTKRRLGRESNDSMVESVCIMILMTCKVGSQSASPVNWHSGCLHERGMSERDEGGQGRSSTGRVEYCSSSNGMA